MLRQEQNDLVTQTGRGTPMGRLFRSYWTPVLLSDELPKNDCPPVRVKVLSESLIAFRDSEGRYGLIDEFCPHRRASMWFGRNEQHGLRCAYHGWKFDVTGRCVDIPSEPESSGVAARIKMKSYPLVLRGGVLWTYMGPPELKPPLPEWEFATVPDDQRFVSKRIQECNWLQAMEGGIDSSHVSFLHQGNINSDPLFKGAKGNQYNLSDARPVFELVESAGGLYIGARRNAENGNYYWRITQFVLPSFTMIAPRGGHSVHGHFWIPIDDEHCMAWSYDYHPARKLTPIEISAMKDGKGVHGKLIPGTFVPVANKDNNYLMDREAQLRGESYSGIDGIAIQDGSLQESMGGVVDRTQENLVATDRGIIMARHRLMQAATELVESGKTPPGVDVSHQRVRSAAIILAPDLPFKEGAKEALTAVEGRAPATV